MAKYNNMKKYTLIPLLFLSLSLWSACNSIDNKENKDDDDVVVTTDSLLVLSYNVCFNSMTHNGTIGSAKDLGAKCIWDPNDTNITICAEHIAQLIDGLPGQYAFAEIDLIGLQESSKWQALQKAAPQTLAKMSALITKQEKEYAATFYNPNKYTLQDSMSGDLDQGRPFQISIFKEGVIFINLHNGHGSRFSYNLISSALSNKLMERLDEAAIAALKNYRIIVVGDFNQIKNYYPQLVFKPFKNAGLSTEVELANSQPISCCDTDGDMPWSGNLVGDFIFDSKHAAKPEVPSNYNADELQSDHRPVVSILK